MLLLFLFFPEDTVDTVVELGETCLLYIPTQLRHRCDLLDDQVSSTVEIPLIVQHCALLFRNL